MALCALVSNGAAGAEWVVNPGVSVSGTYTDNVNLQPAGSAQDDFVLQITPSVTFRGVGARAFVAGTISVPVLLYARTGAKNNTWYPDVTIVGNAELVERLFYIDGSIYATQPYASAFGSQSTSLTSGNDNRYTATSYRVSPYFKGEFPGNIAYELRNSSIWTETYDAPPGVSNSFVNQTVGSIAGQATPLGWFGEFNFDHVKFEDQGWQRINLARAGPRYAISPQLRVQASAGYENDQFPLANYNAVLYGAAIEWRPSPRTTAYASVEHRFFGTSFLVSLDYRTPLTVWAISASRNLTNFPQQLSDSSSAVGVGTLLDRLFKSRIPDPNLRRESVDRYIEQQMLPTNLSGAVNFYTQDILLTESVSATAGLTGTRNNVFFTAFYAKNHPIEGSSGSLVAEASSNSNNTQYGVTAVWAYRVTPVVNLNLSGFLSRTNALAPATGETTQGSANLELNRGMTQHMRGFVGVRFQRLVSDVNLPYSETAVYAGVAYTYR